MSHSETADKILLVDDSKMDRGKLVQILKEHGISHEILHAGNGEEAIALLEKEHQNVKLICLDWQMPKMDGMEFMRQVTKNPQTASIPIIMVTASGSEEAQKCARRVNPNLAGYVVKPFQHRTLMDIILTYLG